MTRGSIGVRALGVVEGAPFEGEAELKEGSKSNCQRCATTFGVGFDTHTQSVRIRELRENAFSLDKHSGLKARC